MENSYMSIANGGLMYTVAIVIVAFVLIQAGFMMYMAMRRGSELGIDKTRMIAAFKSAAITAILPSIAVAVGFFTLAPVLGIPVPWARLSIIGGISVELPCANIGASATGATEFGGENFTKIAFSAAIWAMTLGTMWHLITTALGLKKIKSSLDKSTKKDQVWGNILASTIMASLVFVMSATPIMAGGDQLTALIVSAVVMLGLMLLIKKFKKLAILKNFATPLCMIVAMIFVVLMHL